MRVLACIALLAWPAVARADQPNIHANLGLEVLGSGDAITSGGRLHAGYGRSFGTGAVQPTLSLGATFGWAGLRVDDPGQPGGEASLWLVEAGPEVTLALRFADGGIADNRVFATAAWLYVGVDDEVKALAVRGVEAGSGVRLGVGVSWAGTILREVDESPPRSGGQFLWLVPQQLELVFENTGGLPRYGAVLAWGL